jgi:hypothetical protein
MSHPSRNPRRAETTDVAAAIIALDVTPAADRVETVARAICRACGLDPDSKGADGDLRWRYHERLAQAAIAALDAAPAEDWRDIASDPPPHGLPVLLGWKAWQSGAWEYEASPYSTGARMDNGYSNLSEHGHATHWRMIFPPTNATPPEIEHSLGMYAPETPDERQAAIVAALRKDAHCCDCFAYSADECACGARGSEPGERSFKRKYVEDVADWIESGEWRM